MKDPKKFIAELLQKAHARESIDFYGQKQRIIGYGILDGRELYEDRSIISYEFNLENGSKIVIAKGCIDADENNT